jgi:hypothetical protein
LDVRTGVAAVIAAAETLRTTKSSERKLVASFCLRREVQMYRYYTPEIGLRRTRQGTAAF